jgi:hypothetical protein
VRYSHELGERWSIKNGVVSTLKVCDHEVDVVGAKVAWSAELYWERDLPERYRALSGENALELCVVRLKISLRQLKGRQAAAKQDVDGAATINEHPLEPDVVDTWVEDEGETTRFWNCRPPVCSAKGDFAVGPGREPGIEDEVIGMDDVQTCAFEQLVLTLGLQGHLSAKDGVHGFGGIDVLVMRISILFVIVVIITVTPRSIVNSSWSIILSKLLGVDVLEETAVLHGVIGLWMDLAGTLQSLVVVLLIITSTSWLLYRVDFMIILARALAFVIDAIIRSPVTIISVVTIVVKPITAIAVAVPTTIIAVVVTALWVLGA